jgi:DNA-binding NtrC family response regulator
VSRLLVVDDDIQILSTLQAALRRKGHTVETASNGIDAVSRLSSETFDAVITDLQIQAGDGVDLFHHVRRTDPAMPIVVLSAFASVPAAVEAIKSGASDFLPKPLSHVGLGDVIGRLAERPQRNDADNAEIVTVSEMERKLIMTTLRKTNGNRTHAAKLLGISLRTLRNKLREYRFEEVCA